MTTGRILGDQPQSTGQDDAVSLPEHWPSPQQPFLQFGPMQGQSARQVLQFSPREKPAHVPSPQKDAGQSAGQVAGVSPPLQAPSPQEVPQSSGQVTVVSSPLHAPSPHHGPVWQRRGLGATAQTASSARET